jgi:hypothetical protein
VKATVKTYKVAGFSKDFPATNNTLFSYHFCNCLSVGFFSMDWNFELDIVDEPIPKPILCQNGSCKIGSNNGLDNVLG